MKLAYLVPAPISLSMGKDEVKNRQCVLNELAGHGVEINLIEAAEGPGSIESALEEYLSVAGAALEIERLEQEGYDGVILGCAGDPGLDGLREVAEDMLVIGPGQTGFLVASSLGRRFGVITPAQSTVGITYEQVEGCGLGSRLAAVLPVEMPVLDLRSDREKTVNKVEKVGRELMNRGADVIVLGCMSLAFLRVDRELEERLQIPVVNPLLAAVKYLEAMVAAGLVHSGLAYPQPPKLQHTEQGVSSLRLHRERREEIE